MTFTIWFRVPFSNINLSTVVPESPTTSNAQEVWDLLAKEFRMLSTRP